MLARSIARPKLIDLIILTAATAVGLALAQAIEDRRPLYPFVSATRWIESTAPIVSVGMITILGLRVVRPRPPFWRLARQPGILACTITLASFSLIMAHTLSNRLWNHRHAYLWYDWSPLTVVLGRGTADYILAAWLALAITGQWRPKPDLFDRAGIVLGAYLLMMFRIAPLVTHYYLEF